MEEIEEQDEIEDTHHRASLFSGSLRTKKEEGIVRRPLNSQTAKRERDSGPITRRLIVAFIFFF